jgi:hypothetical protein
MIADQVTYGHCSWPTPRSEPTQRSYSRTPAKLRNVRIAWSTARGAHPDAHDMSAYSWVTPTRGSPLLVGHPYSWVTPTRGSPDPDAHDRLVGHPCSRVLATTRSGRDLHVSESLPDRTCIWNPDEVYSRYIPCIFHVYVRRRYMYGIYHVYTMDIKIPISCVYA